MDEDLRIGQADDQEEYMVCYWRTTEHPGEFETKTEGVDGQGDTLKEAIEDLVAGISIHIDD